MTQTDAPRAVPRRFGALVLITGPAGDVGLVLPTYRQGWQLPGGHAEPGEDYGAAAARELAEETGIVRELTAVLAVDQVPAAEGSEEGLNIVFDGGELTAEEAATAAVPDAAADELAALKFVPRDLVDAYALPDQARRIRAALAARDAGAGLPFLVRGVSADTPQ